MGENWEKTQQGGDKETEVEEKQRKAEKNWKDPNGNRENWSKNVIEKVDENQGKFNQQRRLFTWMY